MGKWNALTRLPLEPLFEAGHYANSGELARATGLKHGQIRDLRSRGVTIRQADQLACAVNLHPTQVWGPAFYQPISDSKRAKARMP